MKDCEIAIVGAGAAGLATAIFAKRAAPDARVWLFEGARAPGAKILVSGGTRCNVTNVEVTERDFNGGRPPLIRRVLRAFPAASAVAFFRELGVPLHEEAGGKLFPDSNRARDVVNALMNEISRLDVRLLAGTRTTDIRRGADAFELSTSTGVFRADAVVLATGGLSLPKTGSDGWGYGIARQFGHQIVPTTPALVPLVIGEPGLDMCRRLSGVSLRVRLDLRETAAVAKSVRGSLLWTHFGISGPAALDLSRHWLRGGLDGRTDRTVSVSLRPESTFESIEARWVALAQSQPRTHLVRAMTNDLPGSLAEDLLSQLGVPDGMSMADLPREVRRRVIHALLAWPLAIRESRGYNYAEVTAGGVSLGEVDMATMESRACPGLYLVGEILDVDGRLGGFNFQWAWSTAWVAGQALGRRWKEISQ